MNNRRKVSVIIPSYNRGDKLFAAVNSVLNQTFRDLEVIIVDDASTDHSERIVKSIDDERVLYLRLEQNRGPSAARNVGIKAAHGLYISFLDSDDEWETTKLEEQLRFFDAEPGTLVVLTGLAIFDETLRKVIRLDCLQSSGDVFDEFFKLRPIGSISMLVPKNALDEIGGFDESLAADEIWDLGARLARKHKFKVVSKPLYIVHQHQDPHQWNNSNLLESLPRLLAKYADATRRHPKWSAAQRLLLGRLQLENGNKVEARRHLVGSIIAFPFVPVAYALLLESFSGIPVRRLAKSLIRR